MLESLLKIDYSNYHIIIIDNASEDESIEKIKDYCNGNIIVKSQFFKYDPSNKPIEIVEISEEESKKAKLEIENINSLNKNITLIKNENNHGFTEGNNIGIRYAIKNLNSDYVLLLNN